MKKMWKSLIIIVGLIISMIIFFTFSIIKNKKSQINKSTVQSQPNNLIQFETSLNTDVGPTIWQKVVINNNGNLNKLPAGKQKLSIYINIPNKFTNNNSQDANLSYITTNANYSTGEKDILGNTIPEKCSNNKKPYQLEQKNGSSVFKAKIGTITYYIAVCNGTQLTPPYFYIYKNNRSK